MVDEDTDEQPQGRTSGEDITDIEPPEGTEGYPEDVDGVSEEELVKKMDELDDEKLIELMEKLQQRQSEPVTKSWEDRMLGEDGTETIKVPDGSVTDDGRPILVETVISDPQHLPDADDDNTLLAQVQEIAREEGEEGVQRWLFRQCVHEPPKLGDENFNRFTRRYREELSDRLLQRTGIGRFFGSLPTMSGGMATGNESPGESDTESPEPTDSTPKTSETGTPSTSSGQQPPSTKTPPSSE